MREENRIPAGNPSWSSPNSFLQQQLTRLVRRDPSGLAGSRQRKGPDGSISLASVWITLYASIVTARWRRHTLSCCVNLPANPTRQRECPRCLGAARSHPARIVQTVRAEIGLQKRELHQVELCAAAADAFELAGNRLKRIDRGGEIKSFAPTQEDLVGRERVVAYYSQAEYTARGNLAEAVLWLILGIVAVLFGFAMSFEKAPPPTGPSGDPGGQSGGKRSSA